MRFAYMDEAGNTGRRCDDPNQPVHLILSLVIDETKIAAAHAHMREIGRLHCPTACRQDAFEFHGADLFAARGPFSNMDPERRIEIFDEVLRGIELAEAEVVIRGVEKAGLERRYATPYHPHDIALMFSIESIERLARERECRILLVADEAKEIEDTALRDLRQLPGARHLLGLEPRADQPDRRHHPFRSLAQKRCNTASRMRGLHRSSGAEDPGRNRSR
jgi:hypothetical protein